MIENKAASSTTKTVLIVEDDADIGQMLATALSCEMDFQVHLALDGFAALNAVRTAMPQLVLLDYMLPGMDGIECAKHLRALSEPEQIAIILMTASRDCLSRKKYLEKNNIALLQKPFELDKLFRVMDQLLEDMESAQKKGRIYPHERQQPRSTG